MLGSRTQEVAVPEGMGLDLDVLRRLIAGHDLGDRRPGIVRFRGSIEGTAVQIDAEAPHDGRAKSGAGDCHRRVLAVPVTPAREIDAESGLDSETVVAAVLETFPYSQTDGDYSDRHRQERLDTLKDSIPAPRRFWRRKIENGKLGHRCAVGYTASNVVRHLPSGSPTSITWRTVPSGRRVSVVRSSTGASPGTGKRPPNRTSSVNLERRLP